MMLNHFRKRFSCEVDFVLSLLYCCAFFIVSKIVLECLSIVFRSSWRSSAVLLSLDLVLDCAKGLDVQSMVLGSFPGVLPNIECDHIWFDIGRTKLSKRVTVVANL